jgi:glycolate oxidase
VTILPGRGRLAGPGRLVVRGPDGAEREIVADKIILATGSSPLSPPGVVPDGERILTSEHLLGGAIPGGSVLIAGAGPTGVELAGLCRDLGAEVTLVEMRDGILPAGGWRVGGGGAGGAGGRRRARGDGASRDRRGGRRRRRQWSRCWTSRARAEVALRADTLLVATGRRPLSRDLGLDSVVVETDRPGHLLVDGNCETSTPGLYAIGDLLATPRTADAALREARAAAAHLCGHPVPPLRWRRLPQWVSSRPQLASLGMTLAQAVAEGRVARVVRVGEARVVVDDETGAFLGLQATGEGAIGLARGAAALLVARGAGTGLAGGALPPAGAVVIATGRLDALGEVDPHWRRVHAEPGVINEVVSRRAAPHGLFYAPDPSSQTAATIGGNVAANAGGPRCVKVGVTSQHVRRLDWFDAQGRLWSTGHGGSLDRGIDLRGLLCGSEGTLGVVCGADLDLMPRPGVEVTLLAEFPRLDDATAAVLVLMASGLELQACEIIDQAMLQAVEAAFGLGLATDVAAVMICEVAGAGAAVADDAELAAALLNKAGARRVEAATDPDARAALWRGRKQAFGAVGRLAPAYISMDVVVPLGALPEMVREIQAIQAAHGVIIATALHAGDGNLHPGVHHDDRDPELTARAHAAADAIALRALAHGGSITGEHGVGLEKRHLVGRQLDRASLRLMRGIKQLFDPADLCNPGKALPMDQDTAAPDREPPAAIDFRWESLTVTAPATTPLARLQAQALARGFWIPVGAAHRTRADGPGLGGATTLGEMVDAGTTGPSLLGSLRPADAVLELWAETGAGEVLHAGAPVLKNVAGYDLVRLIVGSGGCLARPLAVTLQLRPAPADLGIWSWLDVPAHFSGEGRREFLEVLRGHGQPALAVRERNIEGPSLWVLASGRHRDRDLDRLAAELEDWSEDHGLGRPRQQRRDFAALCLPEVLAGLPVWAAASTDWTLLSRRERQPDWPRPRRLVWQSQPEMLWMPERCGAEPVGWFADTVFGDGKLQPLPPPPSTVPRHLLAGLKRLFDPDHRLPCPDWLDLAMQEAVP